MPGSLEDIFFGRSFDGDESGAAEFAEGKILAVTSAGITYTIEGYDGGKHAWGPSPYPQWTYTPPPGVEAGTLVGPNPGDRCLVLFPAGTALDPWVIGWWPGS